MGQLALGGKYFVEDLSINRVFKRCNPLMKAFNYRYDNLDNHFFNGLSLNQGIYLFRKRAIFVGNNIAGIMC